MVTRSELLQVVDDAFDVLGRSLARWPDPHEDRRPAQDEYSRVTNAARYRIVGARADAWTSALVQLGCARVLTDPPVRWTVAPLAEISRTGLVAPVAAGALPIVVCRSRLGEVDDAGVTLGVGDPAVWLCSFPYCGCDACDDGSQAELDRLDRYIDGIVSGMFRQLSRGDRKITVTDGCGWDASGFARRRQIEKALADPQGWNELRGRAWVDPS